jgi:hypothetical protein
MKSFRVISIVAFVLLALFPVPAAAQTPRPSGSPTPPVEKIGFSTSYQRLLNLDRFPPAPQKSQASPLSPNGLVESAGFDSLAYLRDWSKLTFSAWAKNNWEIYIANGNVDQPVRLTSNAVDDTQPRLNRGATEIVFLSKQSNKNMSIYRMGVDGKNITRLTNSDCDHSYPSWSPDGTKILFSAFCSGKWSIYSINRDGKNTTKILAVDEAYQDIFPIWSPDGSKLAWLRFPTGSDTAGLWIANADGSGAFQYRGNLPDPGYLTWAPDGNHFAMSVKDYSSYDTLIIATPDTQDYDRKIGYGLPDTWYLPFGWSPDGHYLGYNLLEWTTYEDGSYFPRVFKGGISPVYPQDSFNGWIFAQWLTLNPSWGTTDLTAPVSRILPLPQYSKLTNLSLTLTGTDPGGAGIHSTDVQMRVNGGGWKDFLVDVHQTSVQLTLDQLDGLQAGDQIEFRSRARDNAMNLQAWKDEAEASTRLYAASFSGSLRDNRGELIPNGTLVFDPADIAPVNSGTNGHYQARLNNTGVYSVRTSHAGYGLLPPTRMDFSQDQTMDFYLPPVMDHITNGGFEAGLDGWTVQPNIPAAIDPAVRHSGENGLRIGQDCSLPCLANPVSVTSEAVAEEQMRLDSQGGVHIFALASTPAAKVVEYTQNLDGTFAETVAFDCTGEPGCSLRGLSTAVDANDTFYAAWLKSNALLNYSRVVFSQRMANGNWSTAEELGDNLGDPPILLAQPDGHLHLLYPKWDAADTLLTLNYRQRPPGAPWGDPVLLDPLDGVDAAALTPDGNLHLFIASTMDGLFDRIYKPGGVLGAASKIADTPYSRNIIPLVNTSGGIRLLWMGYDWSAYNRYYAEYQPGKGWTAPIKIALKNGISFDPVSSPAGWLHLVSGKDYQYQTPDGVWFKTEIAVSASRVLVGTDSRVLFLSKPGTGGLEYAASEPVMQGQSSSVSQTLTVDSTGSPTLAFLYRMPATATAQQSAFKVEVVEGATVSEVAGFSGSQPDWKQAYVDMYDWRGKTVEVRFTLARADGEGNTRVYLDEISLGAWVTPKITNVSPAIKLPLIFGPWNLTIQGQNFVHPVSSVWLGDKEFTPVKVDENTLKILIQPGDLIGYGFYDVIVRNADGTEGVLPGGFLFQAPLFFPMVLFR